MRELNIKDILSNTSDLKEEKKVWYVAIIWRPNAWKSTFVNSLLWEKVSITSKVPQTTRKRVLAIHNDDDSQIIFFDTPWIHKSNKEFKGTGLGLSICSHIVNSLGSKIMVQSTIGKGSNFWFTLAFDICENDDFNKKIYVNNINFNIFRIII